MRAEAVRALTSDDATLLVQIARTDRDTSVRRIAIEKIAEADVLAELAAAESERSLRDLAGERAAQLWQATACGDDAEAANAALSGLIGLAGKLGEQGMLVDVAASGQLPAIRKRAFGELREARALAALAKRDAPQELRTAAVARIDDNDVLRALAIDTTQKEVGLAAVEKLDDVDRLEQVAQKAKHKAVRQKARKIVGEIQEAERAKRPGVPDEVKRKRAERAQLVREVEGVADTFDFARAADKVRKAEAAWSELGDDDAGDARDRFARAVERFWKRKELHEQQARSAEELRAIEREAAAVKERAAAERTPKPAPAPSDEPPDPAREAREAEARARREERDRLKAEEDARRAAQAAERAAKAKEDAERGAAIAASLRAMCDDMEQLAASDPRELRAIDRLLSQATKAFEQIGKVPAADRQALTDRYTQARGKLVTRAGELREAEDWQRWANVPKAEALIQTAREMVAAEATPDLGNRLRQLQALWKEVGPMPQRRSKELWETFKATCDQVYDKVKGVRAVEQEKFAEVAKVKEALIAEAEALADSTDWATTADKLKALQAQWKQSGHLPRKQGDELWKRFRAACDRFFERRKPMLDARHAEEAENLTKKQALIGRARAIADAAPGEGGWGKAIGQIKDLQREWREVGHVPRRDADAVYKAFRAACDALFAKRDAARDAEANAHRAELDAVRAELEAVRAGGDDVVARAIAARAKAHELGALGPEVEAMLRHVLEHHAGELAGTELDPAVLSGKRDKLIARVEDLLPKQAAPVAAEGDVAAQLKAAMRQNAFAELRWSGRDPIEVLEDIKQEWNEVGPILTADDHAQAERFEAAIGRVLEANGVAPRAPEARAGEAGGRRRRRRDRVAPDPAVPVVVPVATTLPPAPLPEPAPLEVVPDAHADAVSTIAGPEEVTATATPIAAPDAITQPAKLPPELPIGMPEPATHVPEPAPVVAAAPEPLAEPPRRKSITEAPKAEGTGWNEDLDTGWDLGDDDPTANPPSSGEMAGDGAVDDSLDQVD